VNPKPSLYQCFVLHELADGKVYFGIGEDWWVTGYHRDYKVTWQINKLIELGYVQRIVPPGDPRFLFITLSGLEVLRRRPYTELVEQFNRRRKS
jgi:hypothetical protein